MKTPWYLQGAGDTFDIYDADDNLLFGVPYVDEPGVEAIDTASGRLAALIVDAVNHFSPKPQLDLDERALQDMATAQWKREGKL